MNEFDREIQEFKNRGVFRELKHSQGLDFCSNDYLGLARSKDIRLLLIEKMQTGIPIGSSGSRLVSGQNEWIESLEDYLSDLFGCESVLMFGSGYLANMGAILSLTQEGTEFFSDEFNHASMIDGMKLCKSPVHIFKHNDLNQLDKQLGQSNAKRKVIALESVYSMDGDSPNLKDLALIAQKSGAYCIIDEAHATGVMGKHGLGIVSDQGFDPEKTLVIHTCGKALGAYGAFVCSSEQIRHIMVNKARSFIYSTALSPMTTTHIHLAFEYLRTHPELRSQLANNVQSVRAQLKQHGLAMNGSHIVPFLIPGNERVMEAQRSFQNKGVDLRAIRSPTVAKGSERLRVTFKSFHTQTDLNFFSNHILEHLK